MITGEKVEGRKSLSESRSEAVALAKALARKKPKGGKMSLRAVSAAMAAQGARSSGPTGRTSWLSNTSA